LACPKAGPGSPLAEPNRRVELIIERDDEDQRIAVTLGRRSDEGRSQAAARQLGRSDDPRFAQSQRDGSRRSSYEQRSARSSRTSQGFDDQANDSSAEVQRLVEQNRRLERAVRQLSEEVESLQSRVERISRRTDRD